jgi:hypothetical protein
VVQQLFVFFHKNFKFIQHLQDFFALHPPMASGQYVQVFGQPLTKIDFHFFNLDSELNL